MQSILYIVLNGYVIVLIFKWGCTKRGVIGFGNYNILCVCMLSDDSVKREWFGEILMIENIPKTVWKW